MIRIKVYLIVLLIFQLKLSALDILTLNWNKLYFSGVIENINNNVLTFNCENKKYKIPVAEIYSLEFENNFNPIYMQYLNQKNTDVNKWMKPLVELIDYKGGNDTLKIPAVLFGSYSGFDSKLALETISQRNSIQKEKQVFSNPSYLSSWDVSAKSEITPGQEGKIALRVLSIISSTLLIIATIVRMQ